MHVHGSHPTIDQDMDKSNSVKLFEPHLYLQLIDSSKSDGMENAAGIGGSRSAGRLPKVCGKCHLHSAIVVSEFFQSISKVAGR